MTFEVVYSRKAERQLEGFRPQTALRIVEGCERLKSHPFPDGRHIKKLKGYEGLFRLRVGDYRVVFRMAQNRVEVIDVISKPDFQKSY